MNVILIFAETVDMLYEIFVVYEGPSRFPSVETMSSQIPQRGVTNERKIVTSNLFSEVLVRATNHEPTKER